MMMIVTAEVPKLGFEFFITFQGLVDPLSGTRQNRAPVFEIISHLIPGKSLQD